MLALVVVIVLESRSLAVGLPRLLILDANGLIQIKERLQNNDPALAPAFVKLKRDAQRGLDVRPLSVTEKKLSPPTGDKHDYMSIAPYWWPNPATPNGLPFIRRDGEVNPERDRSSDRRRLENMIQTVKTLALGYFFTAREDYAAHAAKLLRVWFLDPATKMNPHLKYAQAVPGRNNGRAAGIIETHELSELIDFVFEPMPEILATYRLQLHGGFTLADARALVPYLRRLGVSHLHCSPLLRSRQGSTHGYDVVDPTMLDPELGTEADLAAL
ncbi:MAG TPA: alginate lyase family protein, partial [Candidatus Binatia bacterium]|nr:alginate lyase family protein [Candidatus Binatia bacterium]